MPESAISFRSVRTLACVDSTGQHVTRPHSLGNVTSNISDLSSARRSLTSDVSVDVAKLEVRLARCEATLAAHNSRIQAASDGEKRIWSWLEMNDVESRVATDTVNTKLTAELAMVGKAVELELCQLSSLVERKFGEAMLATGKVDEHLRCLVAQLDQAVVTPVGKRRNEHGASGFHESVCPWNAEDRAATLSHSKFVQEAEECPQFSDVGPMDASSADVLRQNGSGDTPSVDDGAHQACCDLSVAVARVHGFRCEFERVS